MFWKNIKKDIEFLRKKLLVKNPLFQKVEFKKEIKEIIKNYKW